ncbi:helix-turn-helix domain-containing protein [Bacillus sp. JJ1503]|uniref:helix-turn-helix domain-containing protein n=1 Tax=Bacillus sp. JJ1503 TaxID=3122956 RepID=UPI00300082AC
MTDFSYYGYKLKELRAVKGYSTREVANKLNLDHSHIAKIEKGNFPSLPTLLKLLELYNESLGNFFNEKNKWNEVIELLESKEVSPEEMIMFINVIVKLK